MVVRKLTTEQSSIRYICRYIFIQGLHTLFREMFPLFPSLPNKYLNNRIQFWYKKYPLWFMILNSLLLQYFQNPNEGPVCIYFLLITNSGTHLYYMYVYMGDTIHMGIWMTDQKSFSPSPTFFLSKYLHSTKKHSDLIQQINKQILNIDNWKQNI